MSTEGDVELGNSEPEEQELSLQQQQNAQEFAENFIRVFELQIKEVLGMTIAMVYIMEESGAQNQTQFSIQHIPLTSDVLQELTQFKVDLYFAVIERANSYIDLRSDQQFKDYLLALDEIWNQSVVIRDNDILDEQQTNELTEIMDELIFHFKKFQIFLKQIRFALKGLELICVDCQKQTTIFGDIFSADIVLRSLQSANDYYIGVTDRLNDRVNQIAKSLKA